VTAFRSPAGELFPSPFCNSSRSVNRPALRVKSSSLNSVGHSQNHLAACTKSPDSGASLCATSEFSVSLWCVLLGIHQPQRHRELRGCTESLLVLGFISWTLDSKLTH